MVKGWGGEQSRRAMLLRWNKAVMTWSQGKRHRGQGRAKARVGRRVSVRVNP
jgi:hypothetical protein